MLNSILEVKNLDVCYGSVQAVKSVSFSVKQGSIVSILGSNGAGKTTILRTLSGLLRPLRGEISFFGERIDRLAPHLIVKRGLSHCPEGRGLFPNLTVAENLDLGAWILESSKKAKALDGVLSLFSRLKERLKQAAGTLSGGEQQMLAIGRALMAEPKCLLLDEPSLGLAPQVIETIFEVIQKVNSMGMTVLLVEQNAHMALEISQEAFVLSTGHVHASGLAKDLLKSEEIQKAYLGL